jgi:predicted acetyltransferase
MFEFHDPGRLVDDDLELILVAKDPADPVRDYAPAYKFEMRFAGQETRLGRIALRVGDTQDLVMYAGNIGYGVEPEHRGHHYAARAVRLLLPLAQGHGMKTVWITCNPDNFASRRTCELGGATLVEIVALPKDNDQYLDGERQKCRYRLDLEQ